MSVGRGDVEDAAAVLACHRSQFVLHTQEYPENVRVMDGLEVFDGGILDRAELAFEAGIVHGNVEPAEFCDRFVDKVADLVFFRHVGVDELCLGAKRFQLCDEGLPLVVVPAGHHDLGAFAGECHSSGSADPGEGAGNENNLLSHLFPSTVRNVRRSRGGVVTRSWPLVTSYGEGSLSQTVAGDPRAKNQYCRGCNRTSTSLIPKPFLSLLDERRRQPPDSASSFRRLRVSAGMRPTWRTATRPAM